MGDWRGFFGSFPIDIKSRLPSEPGEDLMKFVFLLEFHYYKKGILIHVYSKKKLTLVKTNWLTDYYEFIDFQSADSLFTQLFLLHEGTTRYVCGSFWNYLTHSTIPLRCQKEIPSLQLFPVLKMTQIHSNVYSFLDFSTKIQSHPSVILYTSATYRIDVLYTFQSNSNKQMKNTDNNIIINNNKIK